MTKQIQFNNIRHYAEAAGLMPTNAWVKKAQKHLAEQGLGNSTLMGPLAVVLTEALRSREGTVISKEIALQAAHFLSDHIRSGKGRKELPVGSGKILRTMDLMLAASEYMHRQAS